MVARVVARAVAMVVTAVVVVAGVVARVVVRELAMKGGGRGAPPPKIVRRLISEYVDRKKGTDFFKLTTC